MTNFVTSYLKLLWANAAKSNNNLLKELIDPSEKARVLDIGLFNGKLIIERVNKIKKPEIYGVDIVKDTVASAKKLGIIAIQDNIENGLSFKNNFFDIVSANQIIEHVRDTDYLISEIYRVLKPGGYLLISTENMSSWHNIFALISGWQAFSQHVSSNPRIGKPFCLTPDATLRPHEIHIKLFTLRGLRELLENHGFSIEKEFGAGYYPFPHPISRFLSSLDRIHSAFIGIKARKLRR